VSIARRFAELLRDLKNMRIAITAIATFANEDSYQTKRSINMFMPNITFHAMSAPKSSAQRKVSSNTKTLHIILNVIGAISSLAR
jgi:hypothetical protein